MPRGARALPGVRHPDRQARRRGVWTICPNRAGCPGQLFQAVKQFVSRGAMDIEGLGEERVLQFLRDGLIDGIADIYELERSS